MKAISKEKAAAAAMTMLLAALGECASPPAFAQTANADLMLPSTPAGPMMTSLAAGGKLAVNDYWELRGNADSNSLAVPLLARYNGISGWSSGFGGSWRASERLALHGDYSHLIMSDNNIRREASMRGAATVFLGPFYKGVLGLEFSIVRNSRIDAPYYNPKNAHTAQISFVSDWISYQRYSRSCTNRLILSVGRYAEHGFGSHSIGGVSYEARTDLNDAVSVTVGAGYIKRAYGGDASSGPEAHIGFNLKFR